MRLLTCFTLLVFAGSAIAAEKVSLRYRAYRNWSINLPTGTWFTVGEGIKLVHANGDRFAVGLQGNTLQIDTNGDGRLDRTIKPLVDPDTNVSTARVVLKAKTRDGGELKYAIRLRKDTVGWEWAPGGAMAGTINTKAGPIPVRVIDQNGNGSFNDYGQDAMIVGSSVDAMFLSRTIMVGDELRSLEITASGTALTLNKYTGPTSTLDMSTSFASKARLLSAILLSTDGQNSFDCGIWDGPVQIPAATYKFVTGSVGLGKHRAKIGNGTMAPFELTSGDKQTFNWGGPARSEFRFARQGDQIQFSPQSIWFYGIAGEEYSNWTPIGKSPEFKVVNTETGAVLKVATLPGSC